MVRRKDTERTIPSDTRTVKIGAVGEKGVSINGEHFAEGATVDLNEDEISRHRAAGVPLIDHDPNEKKDAELDEPADEEK